MKSVIKAAYESVLKFNAIGGRTFEPEPNLEFWKKLKNQLALVQEELDETIKAVSEEDEIETLDGLCDIFVCVLYAAEMLEQAGFKTNKAMMAVCNNNLEKYTTDWGVAVNTAEKYGEGYAHVDSVLYNGVDYFCVKRSEGDKILKVNGFVPVKLEEFVPSFKEGK